MNDMNKLNTDMEEARKGLLSIVHENRYAALGAGVLASVGAALGGPAGSAVGGAVGGLIGFALDSMTNSDGSPDDLDDDDFKGNEDSSSINLDSEDER